MVLEKTAKSIGYLEGKPQLRKQFDKLKEIGFDIKDVRAIRKYSSASEKHHTVEISQDVLLSLITELNTLRDKGADQNVDTPTTHQLLQDQLSTQNEILKAVQKLTNKL